jgi:hypothetical protein
VPSLVEKRLWQPVVAATAVGEPDPIDDLITNAVANELTMSEV